MHTCRSSVDLGRGKGADLIRVALDVTEGRDTDVVCTDCIVETLLREGAGAADLHGVVAHSVDGDLVGIAGGRGGRDAVAVHGGEAGQTLARSRVARGTAHTLTAGNAGLADNREQDTLAVDECLGVLAVSRSVRHTVSVD